MEKIKVLCTGGSGFIGTHFVDKLLEENIEVVNIDKNPPNKPDHRLYWECCNILDADRLLNIFFDFKPTVVIHLAARTKMEGESLNDFVENIQGTSNVLHAITKNTCVSRVIITSSQHVRKPGSGLPEHDQDFNPFGLYGQSKVLTENLTREANLPCSWVIIRPTNVWGPWHPSLPGGLWSIMKKGLYVHPKNDRVIRGYGYVKNVVWQIEQLLSAPSNLVDRKVFYVGDRLIPQCLWVESFHKALTNRNLTEMPGQFFKLLALFGDFLSYFRVSFPMNGQRYFNLSTPNPVPMDPIYSLFGEPPFSLEEGITETVDWLDQKTNQTNK